MNFTKKYLVTGVVLLIGSIIVLYFFQQLFLVPNTFPVGKNFVVNENETLNSISERLKKEKYITSPFLFRLGVSFLGKDRAIQLGGYIFDSPRNLSQVVATFVKGRPDTPLLSITVPEGSTSYEVAEMIVRIFPSLSAVSINNFIVKYHAEGRLFPSTYFLLPSYTERDIIQLMLSTFTKKVESIITTSSILPPLTSLNDVIVLASILEGEAKTEKDMKIVSGILLTRLTRGMLLQVDVAKETYKEKGLPNVPLNNPGLVAILAVLNPIFTGDLYYITGNDGMMYYAKTFEEHKQNIRKYLK